MDDPYLRRALKAVAEADSQVFVVAAIRTGDVGRFLDTVYGQLTDDPNVYVRKIQDLLRSAPSTPAPQAPSDPSIPSPTPLSPAFSAQMERLAAWFRDIDMRQSRAIRSAGMRLALGEEDAARAALRGGM